MRILGWNEAAEMANGVWSILAFWLSIFLTHHLFIVWRQRRIPVTRFVKLPLSMQLAMGMLVVTLAIFITRSIVWWQRYSHNGVLNDHATATLAFLVGTGIGIIGLLVILRTVSKPIHGHWPWLSALASVIAYFTWWASGFV